MTSLQEIPKDAAPAAGLSLALLGPPQIALDGLPLTFTYDKVPALLAYLAVEADRPHRRTALAGMLWPEQDEAAARHNLSQALFSLRRALRDDPADPLLLTTRDSVRLSPGRAPWIDVADFLQLLRGDVGQLRRAVALYRGEFLEGWGIGDSAGFEEWMLLTRERLRSQACDALRQLTEPHAAEAAARCDDARRWVALDPLSEEAHRRLMRALAENGQRTAALAQFEQCRRILLAELAIEPEPETAALYEELRRGATTAVLRPAPPREALPLPPTRLVDRGRELAELSALLADAGTRLVTIIGPGGVGKTRLALHAAANAGLFADGVCFVPLAPLRAPSQLLAAIAQALGVPQSDARPLEQLVAAALARRHLLLLLDNCEHLLPDAAALIAQLLAAAPHVVVLATSRAALRLSHERRYQLAPLGLEGREQAAAVTLFVERARAARPSVELDYDAIGAICRRLDGLPLAIELAATRARLLSPRELLARLERRLPLLSGGPRDLPERHQTMHATITWSYQLLDAGEQALFRRLAVFAGGWTVAAAEAVCADLPGSAGVLDGLAALLDASLITEVASDAGEPRCTMLETIREYAHGELVAHGELDRARQLHARYIASLASRAAEEFNGPDQLAWLRRWDDELDNLRAALGWCSANAVGMGLRLAGDLHRYWDIRGYRREGLAWLEALLERAAEPGVVAPTSEERAYGLLVAGTAANFLSEFALASRRLRESLELYQQLGDRWHVPRVLNILGNVALGQGRHGEAEGYYRESLALRRELNHTVGMASTLNNLALVTQQQGDLRTAKVHYDESLSLYRQVGDRAASAFVMSHIASILLHDGEYGEAERVYAESHAIAQELGNKPGLWLTLTGLGDVARKQRHFQEAQRYYRQSLTLAAEMFHIAGVARDAFCFAALAWAEGRVERAATLLGASNALNRGAQLTSEPHDVAEFDQHVAWARGALDADAFDAAWARGQALTLEQAAALALGEAR